MGFVFKNPSGQDGLDPQTDNVAQMHVTERTQLKVLKVPIGDRLNLCPLPRVELRMRRTKTDTARYPA